MANHKEKKTLTYHKMYKILTYKPGKAFNDYPFLGSIIIGFFGGMGATILNIFFGTNT